MIPKSGHRFSGKDHAPPVSWSEMTIRRKSSRSSAPHQPAILRSYLRWLQVNALGMLQFSRTLRLTTRQPPGKAQQNLAAVSRAGLAVMLVAAPPWPWPPAPSALPSARAASAAANRTMPAASAVMKPVDPWKRLELLMGHSPVCLQTKPGLRLVDDPA